MGRATLIEWAHHTFNPWRGCSKVSPGCVNCYAERLSGRNSAVFGIWGPQGTRVIASEAAWREPLTWDRWAGQGICHICGGVGKSKQNINGVNVLTKCLNCIGRGEVEPYRARVFCASLADILEAWEGTTNGHESVTLQTLRLRLFSLIESTSNIDYLLLTKRPENATIMMPPHWFKGEWPRHAWMGISAENQRYMDERSYLLRKLPAHIRFVSYEPAIGPIWNGGYCHDCKNITNVAGVCKCKDKGKLHWWICGGESGHSNIRAMHPLWPMTIRDECGRLNVAYHFKQWGEYGPRYNDNSGYSHAMILDIQHMRRFKFEADDYCIDLNGRHIMRDDTPSWERAEYPVAVVKRQGKRSTGRVLAGNVYDNYPEALEIV